MTAPEPSHRRPRGRAAAVLLTMALGACLGGPAGAQTPPPRSDAVKATALAAVREGNRLLVAGEAAAALAKFQEAHRLVGGDKLYYNFGQAYRAMPGHEVEAYQAFQRYLDGARSAAPETLAAARAEQAEVRKKIALLTLTSTPVGATLRIDGRPGGETPVAHGVPVLPGAHVLRLEKDGYAAWEATMVLTAGQALDKDVVLSPAGAPTGPLTTLVQPPATKANDSNLSLAIARPDPAASRDASAPGIYRRWWFWAGLGAVAAVVVGVTIAVSGGTQTEFVCPMGTGQTCQRL